MMRLLTSSRKYVFDGDGDAVFACAARGENLRSRANDEASMTGKRRMSPRERPSIGGETHYSKSGNSKAACASCT